MNNKKWSTTGIETSQLGFGCMRLPVQADGKIDEALATKMLDKAYAAGINYYDTAYVYHNGESESFLGKWMKNQEREKLYVTTKMPMMIIQSLDQAKAIFEEQLQRLQTDYIDCYLMHGLNENFFKTAKDLGIIDYAEKLKKEGKIKALGFSFHDNYKTFEEIINYRDWDLCQIQLNYMDVDIQAGLKGSQLATQKGIPLIIMEPLKGGSLTNLPDDIAVFLKEIDPASSLASFAFRWFADLETAVILSGMSTMEQLDENLQIFENLTPLGKDEKNAIEKIRTIIGQKVNNGCTACRYCMPCPAGVDIPQNFSLWNDYGMYHDDGLVKRRWGGFMPDSVKAKHCIDCGKCEELCPQELRIRADLAKLQKEFDAVCGITD
ncbi:aldo/keto reductase [Eubacteriaceae bacterium ES3]|nr:aldo/keto reductase [Eubacteriaceae bacterium ES3]